MLPSCALLGEFAIGARVALLWQHNANPSYKCEREMLASALYSLYAYSSLYFCLYFCNIYAKSGQPSLAA